MKKDYWKKMKRLKLIANFFKMDKVLTSFEDCEKELTVYGTNFFNHEETQNRLESMSRE